MSALALLSIAIGILIIAVRAPLILAPQGTMGVYWKLIATHTRIRGMGVCVAALGLALAVSARGSEQGAPWILSALGCLLSFAAVFFLLIFPSLYQRVAERFLDAVCDPPLLRAIGAVGVALGTLFVYLGVALL